MSRLLTFLRRGLPERAPELRDGFNTYALHGDKRWGDSITWFDRHVEHDANHRRVVGWTTPRPRVGDRLLVEMQSGRCGVWVFTEVEYCADPDDMFFADVSGAIGYAERPRAGGAFLPEGMSG